MKKEQFELFSKIPLNFLKDVIHPGLLYSIMNDQQIMDNQLQKDLLKDFEVRETEYILKKVRLGNLFTDFREIELVINELKFCKTIIKKADDDNYLFEYYFSINKYQSYLENKFRILTKPDFGILHRYDNFNSQEVVFLFLWKWKAGLLDFKNQSALCTYLESHCASSTGKLKSTKAIISKILSDEIHLPLMIKYIESLDLPQSYIKF